MPGPTRVFWANLTPFSLKGIDVIFDERFLTDDAVTVFPAVSG
jgi:hypothetical protein